MDRADGAWLWRPHEAQKIDTVQVIWHLGGGKWKSYGIIVTKL
jgi:hypothetical protein